MSIYEIKPSENLDEQLNAIPEKATIHLLPGEHVTAGRSNKSRTLGIVPKREWTIIGHSAVLRFQNPNPHPNSALRGMFMNYYDENVTGFSIQGVQFDLASSGGAISAVAVIGESIAIRNCRAINAGNAATEVESFVFNIRTPIAQKAGYYNLIQDCFVRVGESTSARTTCFSLGGMLLSDGRHSQARLCQIKNCVVDGTNSVFAHGFTVGTCDGVVIDGCMTHGVKHGYYQDTGYAENLTIGNCSFLNTETGVFFNLYPSGANPLSRLSLNKVLIANNVISYTLRPITLSMIARYRKVKTRPNTYERV